ncbi:hypothetical protein A3B32_00660 [Candidatus Uhrbacteria bacterium RIFCSPLOWO2_01_FULL_53_9]|uniref:Leucine-binding protein domain-containing protein n=1 Tax=Candidatus Uhrbacteria bacterium RIFCSPLOWO2_01_FULL_53_9 TaxID=1802403 RepID=A0A1F7UYJ4_9BACT|nr:MAG: hypothetical protein A3B32_00660 [Candidatus Uhrbacteria bacterium RIFCSPLOWO2_01_FULL_53_9]
MNNRNILWIVVAVIVVGGGLWLLSGDNKTVSEEGPIKIGVSSPLSGEAASYGESARAGALLAQKEINEAGGVNGRMIELVFEDDTCSPSGVSAMQKLVNVDKVSAIIGPVCSPVAGAAIPIARSAEVPLILIGASAPGLAGGPDSIFSTYPSDAFQGKFAAEYLYSDLGARKVAVLYVNNEWGVGLRRVFVERFKELGGEILFDEGVAQDVKDVRTQVSKIKNTNPDIVYVPLFPAGGIAAIKQFKEAGVDVPLIGGDAFLGDEIVNSGVSEGVMYTAAKVNNTDEFKAQVKALTGVDANIIAPLAYDALKIYAGIMEKSGTDAAAVVKGLNDLTYTEGVSFPEISYDDNGDLEKAAYEVFVYKNGKAELVK